MENKNEQEYVVVKKPEIVTEETICSTCGNPAGNHPYRHPFQYNGKPCRIGEPLPKKD